MRPLENFNLCVLNLWVGLCDGHRGLPDFMMSLGYEVKWIERTWKLSGNDGTLQIKPELCIVSHAQRHLLLMESKGGQNAEKNQLARYADLPNRPENIATIADPIRKDEVYDYDCMVVGQTIHAFALAYDLRSAGFQFPLITVDSSEIKLHDNHFSVTAIETAIGFGVEINWDYVPRLFHANLDSSNREIAEQVVAVLIDNQVMGTESLTTTEVCQAIWTQWGRIHESEQSILKRRVRDVLRVIAYCLDEVIAYREDKSDTVDFVEDLFTPKPDDSIEIQSSFLEATPGPAQHYFMPRQQEYAQRLLDRVMDKMENEDWQAEIRKIKREARSSRDKSRKAPGPDPDLDIDWDSLGDLI